MCQDTRQPAGVFKINTTYLAVWDKSRISKENLIQSFLNM